MTETISELKALLEQRTRKLEACEERLRTLARLKNAAEMFPFIEERFQTIFRNTSAGMALTFPDGRFIEVNPAFCSFLGYTADELMKLTVAEITHPDDREETRRLRREAAAGQNRSFNLEKRYLRKDGATVWGHISASWYYDEAGKPVYSVALIQDITERKRAEEALLESEKRLRRAISEAPFPVMIHAEDGEILQMSRVWTELTGYTRHDIRTVAEWTERAFDERREAARAEIEKMYRLKERKKGGEYIITSSSGEKLVWDFSSTPLGRLPDGRRLVLSMAVDVTDRKLMEEKIEILNTDLACRATELETANMELEAFNYTVSHDLRKPLTSINAYCQVIEELCGEKLDEHCMGYVRQIHDGTLHMNRLIDTLLNFSRLTQIEMQRQPVDLSELARCITAGLNLTEPQRTVTFIIEEKVRGNGDANLLRVVLENLFGNAWKYTAKKEAAVIEFGVTEHDGEPAYFVRDNGVGFDMAHAKKLFVPFQRLPGTAEFQGHGIGLATVHRIIKRHGGKVWAEGKPGEGATFYFTLPADKTALTK